jgi:DNA-binding CsgD family transcriptional regulator
MPLNAYLKEERLARGQRLKSIRKLLNISLLEFANHLGISIFSLYNWEVNKNNGLPDERIPDIISSLLCLGLNCTYEWLAYGQGLEPRAINSTVTEISTSSSTKEAPQNTISVFDKFITSISNRKRQCLELLLEGKSAKETALLLNLSHRTVEAYIDMLKVKFDCRTKLTLISRIHQMKEEPSDYV